MKDRDQLGIKVEPSSVDIACALIVIGVGCVAYEHVPYYGATPIEMGAAVLVIHVAGWLWKWALE